VETTTSLDLTEGIELAYALVARVAEDLGVRALAIKGRVSEAHGLRTPRPSVDVDFLVEPARHGELVDALLSHGWQKAPTPSVPPAFGYHSTALFHPSWPCELDLHDRFPGFLADPADVFDELWIGHTFIVAAGVAVPAAGLEGAALVAALHGLRTPSDPRNARELVYLVSRLSSHPLERDRLRSLAERTGALVTARPFLAALGIDAPHGDQSDPDLVRWTVRQATTETRNVGWLLALRRTPLWRWPAMLISVLLSTEPVLRRYYPQAPPGRRGVWLARWWRLRLALRDLPRGLRTARRLSGAGRQRLVRPKSSSSRTMSSSPR
jgi:hypothetical protein